MSVRTSDGLASTNVKRLRLQGNRLHILYEVLKYDKSREPKGPYVRIGKNYMYKSDILDIKTLQVRPGAHDHPAVADGRRGRGLRVRDERRRPARVDLRRGGYGEPSGSDVVDVVERLPEHPVRIGELFATVYKGLGIDPGAKVRDNLGRPLELAEGKPIAALV